METENKSQNDATESKQRDSLALPEIQERFAQFLITLSPKEAKAQLDVYTKLNEVQLRFHRARHEMELEKQNKHHQHWMDVLKFIVPVFSGLIFAALGLVLIHNQNSTIQYMGVSLLFIGACALIPGIPKVLTNILEAVRGLHALALATQKIASEAAETERKKRKP